MDLIYADKNRLALGELDSFDIDYDATGEKNFELTIDEFILKKGYWFFIPNTEIGGIVDSVTINTADNSVKYNGRNFRGILNAKIIDVPRDLNYVSVQGDIQEVINELLTDAELNDVFTCVAPDTENVDSYVDYAFEPFCTLYDGIMAIAESINFKLIFSYNTGTNKVEITPMLIENFTDFLTYTKSSSVNLEIQDNAMVTNHFILVGYDKNDKRYQIDLFVNENSQIMDFATVLAPIMDSQYILDNRNQVFFGIEEKTAVTITDSISPIENYQYLSEKPDDWKTNYGSYFYQKETANGDGVNISYENFEPTIKYKQLSSEPDDWDDNYANYFYKEGDQYKSVDGTVTKTESYVKVKKKPKGWHKNYRSFYYYETDGLTYYYTSVDALSKNYYKKQKYKPTDWDTSCNSYYEVVKTKDGKTKYQSVKVDEKTKQSPKWKKYKYYTKVTKQYAPKFTAKTVYKKKITTSDEQAPTFVANRYYRQYQAAPYFTGCYQMVLDHYGGMISSLLENLEIYPINKQEVSIADFDADIGDVVGGYDTKTGITLSAPIINIIYRIERGIQRSIEYTLGG